MMLNYKGKAVTLDNYRMVFKDWDDDYLDEMRSAILDGIPLYLYKDKVQDAWHLHQVRLAIRDTIPTKFYVLPGEALRRLRRIMAKGINPEPIEPYLDKDLSPEVWDAALLALERGQDMSLYDFTLLPTSMAIKIKKGFSYGLDMSMFVNGRDYTHDYIQNIITLKVRFGADVEWLIDEGFSEEVIAVLARLHNLDTCTNILSVLKLTMKPDEVEVLAEMYDVGFPDMPTVTQLDDQGYLKFMAFQLERILEAFTSRIDYRPMLDPNLGYGDLNAVFLENDLQRKSRFRGSFRSLQGA